MIVQAKVIVEVSVTVMVPSSVPTQAPVSLLYVSSFRRPEKC